MCFTLFAFVSISVGIKSKTIHSEPVLIFRNSSQYDACLQTAPAASTSVCFCAYLC